MTITGLDRAQALYDAQEPPSAAECYCDRWICHECGAQYDAPGECREDACREGAAGPRTLTELDDAYLLEGPGLARDGCPAHGGCQCGDERCRECG